MLKFGTGPFLLIAMFSLVAGCGGHDFGPLGSVSGKLTLDGQVLPAGTKVIFMHPVNGHAGYGMTDTDGNYGLEWRRSGTTHEGLPVGRYQVILVPADSGNVDDLSAEEMLEGGGSQAASSDASIPVKFLRTSTSGIEYDISEGSNEIDIDARSN